MNLQEMLKDAEERGILIGIEKGRQEGRLQARTEDLREIYEKLGMSLDEAARKLRSLNNKEKSSSIGELHFDKVGERH